jgi:C4-dicarboxylate-specific signal transduction histidine kinase
VLAVANEAVDLLTNFQAVSLLDVLMLVSTDLPNPRFQIESSFEGQTCLVKGNEAVLTETLRGFLENALLSSGDSGNFEAAIRSTGKKVMLTLSEQGSGSEWSLQFPEIAV